MKIALDTVSLDMKIGESEDSTLGSFIEDESAVIPEKSAKMMILSEELNKVIETLSPREQKVITLRYGLIDGQNRTLDDIGKMFCITRERIRQIEERALWKLRKNKKLTKVISAYQFNIK